MASEILQLSEIISASTSELVELSKLNGWSLPVLNEPFSPAKNIFRSNPKAAEAATRALAASLQLYTTLMTPAQATAVLTSGPLRSAAMRVCMDSNVPEILRDAGANGMHVSEITAQAGSRIDSTKLARLMRFLAKSHYYFREVTPNVFAHTMPSSVLDTQKPLKEILKDPQAKHDGTRGPVALVEFAMDDIAKSAYSLMENMTDPQTAFSDKATHSPFQRAFHHDMTFYDWYALPEQRYRHRRFDTAMAGLSALWGEEIWKEFNWNELAEDSVVIDVGGGIGTSAQVIHECAPHLKIIVQDMPHVVEAGIKAWQAHSPKALESEKVIFQSHDFFAPQPDNKVAVFVMKNILHNWGDSYNLKMLTNLRAVASPETKLLIVGSIIPYLCENEIETHSQSLLPEYRLTSDGQFIMDMVMLNCYNAREYTRDALSELLHTAGWELHDVIGDSMSLTRQEQLAVASPI